MRKTLLSLLLLLIPTAAIAQPADATRVLRRFDFEERSSGNVEDVPMGWVKLEGPGMPHYVNGRLATEMPFEGKYAFRFDLNGGSLIYRYPHGKVRVHPQNSYRISTMVKAPPMPNARARLTAYFTDLDGHPIKSTIHHSDPYAGAAGDDWHRLQIELEAADKSAWLVLELGLVQPAVWQATTLGKQSLFEQDIHGSAWFDNLEIAQVPRVRLGCDRPGNVFLRSDPLVLQVRVEDRITADLLGQLIVRDAAGKVVFQRSGALELTPADPKTPEDGAKVARINLPDLPAGWYRAQLQMTSRGVPVGDESIDLIRLADDVKRIAPDPRFGMVATSLPFQGWRELSTVLPYLGAARVKLAVWNAEGDVEGFQQAEFARVLEDLRDLRITPTACLAAVPPRIAASIGGNTWGHLLKAPVESWQPQLSYMVSRHAGYLDRWQFGLDDQASLFVTDPQMRLAYQRMYEQFSKLVEHPDLAMPWPAWFDLEGQLPATVALTVPADVLPAQVPLYMQDLRTKEGQQLSLSLQMLSRQRYGRDAQLRDLVQRVAYALSANAQRIDLPLPFNVRGDGGQMTKQPEETLLVIRTLMKTLGNSTYKGRVPVADDVEAFLFDRHGEGVLLMWNKADRQQPKPVQIVLGKQPQRVDLFGNISPVLQPRDASGVIDVDVGTTPFFLVGIDGALAQFRSSFALDNPLLESSFKPHLRRLKFKNPYSVPISGKIKLIAPDGWSIVATAPNFSLSPGETWECPITIEFPYNSFAGEKSIVCDVQLQADQAHHFRVPVPLKLGLGDVGLSTIALRDKGDVIVQQVITNYSDKPIDYTAFAVYPGQARQERLVTKLKPGATTIKKYRFTNVDPAAGKKLRSGVKETEGTRVLNDEVVIQ